MQNTLKQLDIKYKKAIATVINSSAKSALSAASDLIRKKYNIKKKILDKKFSIEKRDRATLDKPYAIVTIKPGGLKLRDFSPTQIKGKRGRPKKNRKASGRGGVKVKTLKGAPKELIRSKDKERGSFLWNKEVYLRGKEKIVIPKGKHSDELRQPVRKLFGPNPQQLFYPKEEPRMVIRKMEDKFYDAFEKKIDHEIERRFNK